jgi:hypothetical protein
MADSPVKICNNALIKLGAERINALTDDNKRARLCNERYNDLRREVLRCHPWNFALKRVELVKLVTVPEFEFNYEFQLPVDVLRVLRIDESISGGTPFTSPINFGEAKYKIEGRKLLSNDDTVKILYIYDLTDTTKFDANFDDVLATRIAAELAYNLVQSNSLATNLFNLYDLALGRARTKDGQEGSPDDLNPDFFINARF